MREGCVALEGLTGAQLPPLSLIPRCVKNYKLQTQMASAAPPALCGAAPSGPSAIQTQ